MCQVPPWMPAQSVHVPLSPNVGLPISLMSSLSSLKVLYIWIKIGLNRCHCLRILVMVIVHFQIIIHFPDGAVLFVFISLIASNCDGELIIYSKERITE